MKVSPSCRHGRRRAASGWLRWTVVLLLSSRGLAGPEPPDPEPDPSPAATLTDPSRSPPDSPDTRPRDRTRSPDRPPTPAPAETAPTPAPAAPAPQAAPAETPVAETPAQLDERFADRRRLNHVLYRDRRYRVLLDRAQEQLRSGELLSGFEQVREILDAPEDVYVWDEARQRAVSAVEAANQLLDSLTVAQRSAYERYCGGAAEAALSEATARGDLRDLLSVARQYPETTAGRQAARGAAGLLFDQGSLQEAARLWEAVAAQGTGLSDLERQKLAACRNCGPQGTPPAESAVADNPSLSTSIASWTTPGGAISGRRSDSGSLPYHRPLWSAMRTDKGKGAKELELASYEAANGERSEAPMAEGSPEGWLQGQWDAEEAPITPLAPLIVSNLVIVREFDSIVLRDLASGKVIGRHPCGTALDGRPTGVTFVSEGATPTARVFDKSCAENTLLSSLTSDGECVFFIDELTPPASAGDGPAEAASPANRLVALRLQAPASKRGAAVSAAAGEATEVAWKLGGNGDGPLAGHFFLGPPAPFEGGLIVLTEFQGQVNLLALDARTGAIRTRQGLTLIDRPITADRDRIRLAFLPAIADGLALCPTPCGAVVAWDLRRQRLGWVAQYRSSDTSVYTGWRGDGTPNATVYPVQPVVCAPHVFLLPPDSGLAYTLNLADGSEVWRTPRRGAQYVAVTRSGIVALVGSSLVARIDASARERVWERSIEPTAGRGVVLDDRLVTSLSEGRLASIDLVTGEDGPVGPDEFTARAGSVERETPLLVPAAAATLAAAARPHRHGRLGNLAIADGLLVSASAQGTCLFAQAGALQQAVLPKTEPGPRRNPGERRLRDILPSAPRDSSSRELLSAELALTQGDEREALTHLRAAVDAAEPAVAATDNLGLETAATLLREVLWSRLQETTTSQDGDALKTFETLAVEPQDQARLSAARLNSAVAQRDVTRALQASRELSVLGNETLIRLDAAHRLYVSPAALIRSRLRALHEMLTSEDQTRLSAQLSEKWATISDRTDLAAARFLTLCSGTPFADRIRLETVHGSADSRSPLRTETDLLVALRSSDATLAHTAADNLASLWNAAGLRRESRDLARLVRQPGVITDSSTEITSHGRTRTRPPVWSVVHTALSEELDDRSASLVHVDIEEVPFAAADESRTAGNIAALEGFRRELSRPASSTYRLLNLGEPTTPPAEVRPDGEIPPSGARLAIVHRDSARLLHTVQVPSRAREPAVAMQPEQGSFLPLADTGVHGLSLLEGKLLWSVYPSSARGREDRVMLGPIGAGYCIVQTTRGLCRLNSLTGGVEWQRTDLRQDAGLFAHDEFGLFGDDDVLVVFNADLRSYRLLSTVTGEELRTGRLPATQSELTRKRRPYGARLLYFANCQGQPRVQLWDARSDRLLVDLPAHPAQYDCEIDRESFGCVLANGHLGVFSVDTGRRRLTHPIGETELQCMTGVAVFGDSRTWYVNVQQGDVPPDAAGATAALLIESAANDLRLPSGACKATSGILAAYDRRTGGFLWERRDLQNRIVLSDAGLDAPFLLAISRLRTANASEAKLQIEVIDPHSGLTRGQRADLPCGRIDHVLIDHDANSLSLVGNGRRIAVNYRRGPKPYLTTAETEPVSADR